MELTEAEKQIILQIREGAQRELQRRGKALHVLAAAIAYYAWRTETGSRDTFSIFCNIFCYENSLNLDRALVYDRVKEVTNLMEEWMTWHGRGDK